jgi:hypothetical protein
MPGLNVFPQTLHLHPLPFIPLAKPDTKGCDFRRKSLGDMNACRVLRVQKTNSQSPRLT